MTISPTKKEEQLNMSSLTWGELNWIDIKPPTEKATEYLAQNYPFHPLDLDDTLSRIQRPKIDEYKDYLYLVFHFPEYKREERVLTSSQLSVFIGQNYLITLHNGGLKPLVKLFKECQIDKESRQEYLGQGTGFLLYRILDRLVDYCLPILNKLGDRIERVEDEIFSDSKRGTVRAISILRRDIIRFRRIIWPMRAVIGNLEPKVRRFAKKDLVVYFGDMVDHLDKIWDGLDEYKEIIEGLSDTHDSLASNRTNEVVRILTIIATVMLPITVVASIYGMNIPLPFQDSSYSLLFVFLIMLAVIGGILYFLRRIRVI
ncbi:MAG: magnesium/cobalt transporter CorA [Dehalococcoidales bacterium]